MFSNDNVIKYQNSREQKTDAYSEFTVFTNDVTVHCGKECNTVTGLLQRNRAFFSVQFYTKVQF